MPRSGRIALVICLSLTLPLMGAKPGGGTNDQDTYPPVTITPDPASFEARPELGGVLDKSTNVVWGYSMSAVDRTSATYLGGKNSPPRYAQTLLDAAVYHQQQYEYCLQQAASDPDRAEQWESLAAEHLAAVQPLTDAWTDAKQYDNWRLPTVAEARDAIARGIFTVGDGGVNLWTQHPADATLTPPSSYNSFWTSDYGGKKRGSDTAWAYNPATGEAWRTTGLCLVIVVRTDTP